MPPAVSFQEDLTNAFQSVRTSLSALLANGGAEVLSSGETARRLGVTRNLAWKLGKVLGEADIYTALQHLPGEEGIEILSEAMGRVGVEKRAIASFRDALARFDRVVEIHAGDRNTLNLILDSMGGAGSGERLEQSRKMAYRGNSGLWGLQARVRSTTTFIAPGRDDPSMIDLAIVGGVVDFRRLRPGIRWPLLRPRQYHDDGSPIVLGPKEEPIDPSTNGSSSDAAPMLIRQFCSPNMPEIRAVPSRLGWDYELGDGPVGNLGAFTCFFGRIVRGATPALYTEQDPVLDLLSHVTMPVETMLFDVLVHRDLPYLMTPTVMLMASTDGVGPGRSGQSIPLDARPVEVAGHPPMLGTPLIPRYEELAARVFARGGWDAKEFLALRLTIKYPPMHSVTVMRSALPLKP